MIGKGGSGERPQVISRSGFGDHFSLSLEPRRIFPESSENEGAGNGMLFDRPTHIPLRRSAVWNGPTTSIAGCPSSIRRTLG